MSAYLVDKNHIMYLLAAISSQRIQRGYGFSYWQDSKGERVSVQTGDEMAELGNLLWRENMASVSARYPHESSATLPGTTGGCGVITRHDIGRSCYSEMDPVQVLKACDCYAYQTCEHDGWKTSSAFAVIESLRHAAWQSLSGYDAAKWGAPQPMPGAVSLMALATN